MSLDESDEFAVVATHVLPAVSVGVAADEELEAPPRRPRWLPRKFVAEVLATDVKLQTPVVQIEVDGRPVWIARSSVRKV